MKITKITASKEPLNLKNVQPVIVKKGYSPFVQDGTWWQYDESVKGYIDTGIKAEGKDGLMVMMAETSAMKILLRNNLRH